MPAADNGAVPELLTGWGLTAPTVATVHEVTSAAEVERLLATPKPRGVCPRGLGRSYGDAAQNAGGDVVLSTGLSRVRAFDVEKGVITVGAGISLDELTRITLPLGWFVAVTPGTRFVTVGGAIACDVHGKNHHREGSFCDHVDSFVLAAPGGEPRTVRPDDDIFWATAGGMGLTGVVVEATLRLTPVETGFVRVDTERAADLDDAMERMESRDHEYRYSVAWIDLLAGGRAMGRSVLTRGDHASAGELSLRERRHPRRPPSEPRLTAPPWAPPSLLNRLSVRAFNEMWYRKAPRDERGRIESLATFFYPLDGVREWNRLYGSGGLIQYQLTVPFTAGETLRRIVERLQAARTPALLAVLKRFGDQRGLISFPAPGWTLALDLPARLPGLAPLFDELDELVAEAGGRVYLAKDSRLRPELLATMYPQLGRWREVRERVDPEHRMRSDLDRRLALA